MIDVAATKEAIEAAEVATDEEIVTISEGREADANAVETPPGGEVENGRGPAPRRSESTRIRDLALLRFMCPNRDTAQPRAST